MRRLERIKKIEYGNTIHTTNCVQGVIQTRIIRHKLPSDPGPGDVSWFFRMNEFQREETARQVSFKRKSSPTLADGPSSKHINSIYPHIPPEGYANLNLFAPIAEEVMGYCLTRYIAVHDEARNLRSSQVCCFNVLFPLRSDLGLATKALAPVLSGVKTVTNIEFEYTGPEEVTAWLGEPEDGQAGRRRTMY